MVKITLSDLSSTYAPISVASHFYRAQTWSFFANKNLWSIWNYTEMLEGQKDSKIFNISFVEKLIFKQYQFNFCIFRKINENIFNALSLLNALPDYWKSAPKYRESKLPFNDVSVDPYSYLRNYEEWHSRCGGWNLGTKVTSSETRFNFFRQEVSLAVMLSGTFRLATVYNKSKISGNVVTTLNYSF